ncbi:MAG TPA: SCO family protein [Mucilaginibacter sp.]|jgi:protein SCO1/2|nr:SCO family protein [Mucilaginibacter sp.]
MGKLSLIKKILILVLILALPGFLYYLLTVKGKNRYHPLPKFGPKVIAKTTHRVKGKDIPDTIYHTLNDFKLVDQDSKPVSLKTFDGKIFIANFFYTHCPGVCTTMNANMDSLAEAWAKNKMVYFASITVDPDRDPAGVLKEYSKKFPESAKWLFLTGDTSTIYPLARNGFLVNALKVDKDNFIYSDKLMLIDEHKRIRGYYSGASTADVVRLNDEIKVLISEELLEKDVPLY